MAHDQMTRKRVGAVETAKPAGVPGQTAEVDDERDTPRRRHAGRGRELAHRRTLRVAAPDRELHEPLRVALFEVSREEIEIPRDVVARRRVDTGDEPNADLQRGVYRRRAPVIL